MKKTNETYSSPIAKGYRAAALSELKNIRSLVVAALLSAAAIVIEYFQIPIIPGVLEVSFSFMAISLCSFLTGPVLAIPCGIIVDIVGAMIKGYSFFFGYTLSAILGAVIYALFLYRAKLSFFRIAMARLTVNMLINVLLGSVWRVSMSGGFYGYYAVIAFIKNILLYPLEVFVILLFFRAMLPALKQLKLCGMTQEIRLQKKQIIIFFCAVAVGTALLVLYSLNKTAVNELVSSLF